MPKAVKVAITEEANADLEAMVKETNNSFPGRVTKQDIASFAIQEYRKKRFSKDLPKIRAAHTDPILVLKAKIAELEAEKKIKGKL